MKIIRSRFVPCARTDGGTDWQLWRSQ